MPYQLGLFDSQPHTEGAPMQWELPDLSNVHQLALDTETTGLRVYGGDRPVGLSIALPDNRTFYIPWGHREGTQLDLPSVQAWARTELRGKDIWMHTAKFDNEMLNAVDINLEALGCRLHDVAHGAALLHPRMKSYGLDALSEHYLDARKIELPFGKDEIAIRPASHSAHYARIDAALTWGLAQFFAEPIEDKGLQRVLDLEDDLIYATCAMERNGALLDVETLEQWLTVAEQRYVSLLMDIWRMVGFRCEPANNAHLVRLFTTLGIPYFFTEAGNPSFTAAVLREVASNPPVQKALEARKLRGVIDKFFKPWRNKVDRNGILRYGLNQLRADQNDGSLKGTISGRYSSSEDRKKFDSINIQQVAKRALKMNVVKDLPVRRLVVPQEGQLFFSSDAAQIEFRLFAHYSDSARLLAAYAENPHVDFHDVVASMMGCERDVAKTVNFGTLYGMGKDKFARQLDRPIDEAVALRDEYHAAFPEARRLMNRVGDLAERRGWVKTLLGRRREFGQFDTRYYSGVNAVIQGSAADIMKMKLLALYNNRKTIGLTMRFTVHDEVAGDIESVAHARRADALLHEQAFDLKVPILWETKVGANWNDVVALEKA